MAKEDRRYYVPDREPDLAEGRGLRLWLVAQFRRLSEITRTLRDGQMSWLGQWAPGCYEPNSVVIDYPWTMVANKPTCDPPAPQLIGLPTWAYQGSSPTGSITAKTLRIGQRYSFSEAIQFTKIRVYTITGNVYRVWSVVDPDGSMLLSNLFPSFVGSSTGWFELSISPAIVRAGVTFDLIVEMQEPDPTPTTVEATWNYTTPPNPAVPATNGIIHANSTPSILSVDKTPADLSGISVGDVINGPGGIRWSIQGIEDRGTYWDFVVSPALQAAPDGDFLFVFETVTSTPITVVQDTDYWLSEPSVSGRYQIDGGAWVDTEDQYSVDVEYQRLIFSDDWDLISYSR